MYILLCLHVNSVLVPQQPYSSKPHRGLLRDLVNLCFAI